MPLPLWFLLFWKVVDFLTAFFATKFIPYLGHFSHPSTLTVYNVPQWLKGFAQFDGIFYLRIAQNGYSQFEQAFFPLYPLLIKALSPIFGDNYLATSLMIANLSFLLGFVIFRKYLVAVLPTNQQKNINFILIFLLLFPTSFFFGSAYTEGLFFLLVISIFYFLHKKNYWLVALFAFLASLTRFVGVFLFIPIAISLLQATSYKLQAARKYLAVTSPVLGLGAYMLYLWQSVGDPFAFFSSQSAFGAGRSTQLVLFPQVVYRYLKIILASSVNMGYFVSILELSVFLFVFTVLVVQLRDLLRSKNTTLLGINLFSLANLLIPTMTGTFLSIPRFSLLSLSFFIYLGLLKSNGWKALLYMIFFLLHVVLVTLFIQGYFVS